MNSRKGFERPVSVLLWRAANLDRADNYLLATSMFYLGYTELSVSHACKMAEDDPVRNKYIEVAAAMGFDPVLDRIFMSNKR